MKKIYIAITLIVLSLSSFACEICGGGLGSNYTGLLPNFNKRFIGIRYHFNQLYTQLDIDGNITPLSNREEYHTAELWSAWNIGSRWRLMAIIPYSQIQKNNYGTNDKNQKNGIGDINVSGYYNVWSGNNSNEMSQSIWLGIGTKIPSGKYNKEEYTNTNSPNIYQLGSASVDFTGSLNYDIRLKNLGLNTNASYKVNTKNPDEYQYGNKTTISSSFYYNVSLNDDFKIRPNVGLHYENQGKDQTMEYKIEETGGNNTNLNIGVETNLKSFAVGFTYQTPIQQKISSGRTEIINKFLTHITFTF